jgi:serine/threonine protein kinase
MDTDLGQVIKSNESLSEDHIKFFFYQLLRGLKYIHSAGVCHRDLQPKKLLMNSDYDLRISGFDCAKSIITAK